MLGNVISCVCQLEKFCKKGSAEQFSSAICLSPRVHGRSGVFFKTKAVYSNFDARYKLTGFSACGGQDGKCLENGIVGDYVV